jgi:site-specific recombinase XerD
MNRKLAPKMARITLDALLQEYLSDLQLRNLSPRTVELYERSIFRFAAYLRRGQDAEAPIPMASVTPAVAKAYIASRSQQSTLYESHPLRPTEQQPLAKATLHQQIRILRSFGTWLAENRHANPFSGLKLPKLPKTLIDILTEAEIKALFSIYNPDTHSGARWQAMLAFFLDTGVRVSELRTLQLADVDLQNCRAKVVGKGNKERYVLFGHRTRRLLARYFRIYRANGPSQNAFVTVDGETLSFQGVQSIVAHARRRSGIQRLHCHLFRHTFATTFLLNDGNAFELQALLGHESLEMTKRYTHLAQQLSRVGGTPLERRRPSPLDAMERKGIRLDVPRGSGNRPRGVTGRFESARQEEFPESRAGRRGPARPDANTAGRRSRPVTPRPVQPMDGWFEDE